MASPARALDTLERLESEFAASAVNSTRQDAETSLGTQLVIFHLQNEVFALDLKDVKEIIRMPDVVRVPMSPQGVVGLANLRGEVLPVVSLRRQFGLPEILHDDVTRVVVLNIEPKIGLIVDRVANVVMVDNSRIEPAEAIRSTVNADMLAGIVKSTGNHPVIMILDALRLVDQQNRPSHRTDALSGDDQQTNVAEHKQAAATTAVPDQFVSFFLDEQEYAFPIANVKEIIQLRQDLARVPRTSHHVLGVITLRDQLLPIVCLRAIFGLPSREVGRGSKVVVLSFGGDHGHSVGVVMDGVREVLRVNRDDIDDLPNVVEEGRHSGITGICRLDGGRRLVSVLSVERLMKVTEIGASAPDAEEGRHAANGGDDMNMRSEATAEEQVIVFRLNDEEFGVAVDCVQEIVRVPSDLTQVPNAPPHIEGVINLRGAILPVIDQRRRFSLGHLERNDRQRIMVCSSKGVKVGIIVDQVSEVARIPAAAIAPAPRFGKSDVTIVQRIANLPDRKRIIMLLDVSELIDGEPACA